MSARSNVALDDILSIQCVLQVCSRRVVIAVMDAPNTCTPVLLSFSPEHR